MKKLVLVCTLAFSVLTFSQTVNETPIADIDVEYLQIVGTGRLFSDKVRIEIDFGQNTTFFAMNRKETIIKDADGNNVVFNSMIDALNYMSSHGFEFVQAYAFAINNQNVYHYLMKKSDK